MPRLPDFDSLVADYARHRTGYSPALVEAVLAAAPAPRPRVLDLATGTGLAARDLAPRASRLVGCDVALRMLRASPHGERVGARAEALPFRGASFDLATCAQAFHWLEPEATYRELDRVLAPGGVAAVWWKYEDLSTPVARATEAAYERVVGAPAPHTHLARGEPLPALERSPFVAEERRFRLEVPYTVDAYVGYHASRENLRTGAGPRRDAVLAAVREDVAALHPDGEFSLPYVERLVILRRP